VVLSSSPASNIIIAKLKKPLNDIVIVFNRLTNLTKISSISAIVCVQEYFYKLCAQEYFYILSVQRIKYFYSTRVFIQYHLQSISTITRVFIHSICTKYLYSISTLNSSNIHHITHQQKKTTPVTILYAADITQQPKKTTLYSSKDKNESYFEAFLSGILFSFRRAELSPVSVRFKHLSTHFIFSENSNTKKRTMECKQSNLVNRFLEMEKKRTMEKKNNGEEERFSG